MIINLIFGLLWLFKGNMTIGQTKRVKPVVAKGIGAMLIAVSVITTVIYFIDQNSILNCLGLLAPVLALIIGFANVENIPVTSSKENSELKVKEDEEKARERIEKYGVEVISCSNCQTLNSLSFVHCIECGKDLSREKSIRNPYFTPR